MENLMYFLDLSADEFFGLVNVFFALAVVGITLPGTLSLAFATAITYADIPAEVLAAARRWHGTIDEQYTNIDTVVVIVQAHPTWGIPSAVISQIITNRTQLSALIPKCRSSKGSADDRMLRNIVLKTTVGLCTGQVKAWAIAQYYAGVMTLAELHSLGFLLPGTSGGKHSRAEATDVVAEVKVTTVNADIIRVVIDQAAGNNASLVKHGWPPGVHMAVIVITAADGVTEVLRQPTSHLYNDIVMPAGSHGKQFIAKASFLRHIGDAPRFGPQPTFTMPLTTEDLAAAVDRQHHEDYEACLREIERQRREIERLRAAQNPPTAE